MFLETSLCFLITGKESGLYLREEMRGQLKEASSVTSKAFCAFRKELDSDLEGQTSEMSGTEEIIEEIQMSPAITIMKPILRYLQLLCENHNSDLQVQNLSKKIHSDTDTVSSSYYLMRSLKKQQKTLIPELSAESEQQD